MLYSLRRATGLVAAALTAGFRGLDTGMPLRYNEPGSARAGEARGVGRGGVPADPFSPPDVRSRAAALRPVRPPRPGASPSRPPQESRHRLRRLPPPPHPCWRLAQTLEAWRAWRPSITTAPSGGSG